MGNNIISSEKEPQDRPIVNRSGTVPEPFPNGSNPPNKKREWEGNDHDPTYPDYDPNHLDPRWKKEPPASDPILCPSCGVELPTGPLLDLIIQKLEENRELMERTKERLTDYSTYEMGNELIRHLSLYREEMKDAR